MMGLPQMMQTPVARAVALRLRCAWPVRSGRPLGMGVVFALVGVQCFSGLPGPFVLSGLPHLCPCVGRVEVPVWGLQCPVAFSAVGGVEAVLPVFPFDWHCSDDGEPAEGDEDGEGDKDDECDG